MESVLPEATHAAKFWQLNYDGTNPHALTDEVVGSRATATRRDKSFLTGVSSGKIASERGTRSTSIWQKNAPS
jgi:hypothetical protein